MLGSIIILGHSGRISYASHVKKVDREKEAILNDKIIKIEQSNPLSEGDALELERTKDELEQLRKKKIEGIAIRCRANWINDGEKPTRYFCNLENRHFINKTVSFLEKQNGETIEDQDDILREVETF